MGRVAAPPCAVPNKPLQATAKSAPRLSGTTLGDVRCIDATSEAGRGYCERGYQARLLLGIPRPPYTRENALTVETVGRRSGKRRRIPVGYLDDGGRIIVVVEDGSRAHWVRNALANDGRLRIHLRGAWRPARLRILDADPESRLRASRSEYAGGRGDLARMR